MIAIVTILSAFPLGYFVRSRFAANTTYAIAYLWAFTYQSMYLTLEVINDSSKPAFEPQKFPLAYGLVTASIFAVGFGLVALGRFVRDRRTARAARPVQVAA